MSDLIIRIPDSTLRHFWEDKATADYAWWTFKGKPQRVNVTEDLIWFGNSGRIIAGVYVDEITNREMHSDDGRTWNGWHVIWIGYHVKRLNPPVEGIRIPPRGFIYANDEEQAKLRKAFLNV